MSGELPQRRVRGDAIQREVLAAYQPFRAVIAERGVRVLVLRFAAAGDADPVWAARMQASAVSAQQKVRTFSALGAQIDSVAVAESVSMGEMIDRIDAANADPRCAAIIVQSPPPPRLLEALDLIDPAKDVDGQGVDAPRRMCATADGMVRIAAPFLGENVQLAVVGARGFVGAGVVRGLADLGHPPVEFEQGDDLAGLRDVDIVLSATGSAGLLTPAHLHPGHRLVVDAGFVPHPDGPRGDVRADAALLPQVLTPVPGGIGPVEMATLAERLVTQVAAPELSSWRYRPDWLADPARSVRDHAHTDAAATVQEFLSGVARSPARIDARRVSLVELEAARRAWRRRRAAQGHDGPGDAAGTTDELRQRRDLGRGLH